MAGNGKIKHEKGIYAYVRRRKKQSFKAAENYFVIGKIVVLQDEMTVL